ncbi:glycosyltransferase family 39 protein [Salibacteraceae bacterium]|nr:glycosyltransferase family 39 protein [Salibacteraceae bacterium]
MNRDRLVLLILSTLLFIPFLGSVQLFDWDEINFAESAREMLQTGNWWQVTINYEPFREKPPLFFWMQAISMSVFGVGEYAARFPNAICGIITLQVMFFIGLKWQNRSFAWAWVLLYIGSVLPHLYFKSGIIDPWFNLFIFLSVYHLFITVEHGDTGSLKHAAIAGLFSGLAILTKGPVGFLLLLLTFLVWWVFNRFKKPANWQSIVVFALCVFITSTIWFGYETLQNGPWFLVEFIQYQVELFLRPVAGHKQPFFYHFLVVLLGCFPMSIIALSAFKQSFVGDDHALSTWMKHLFWVVLILFSIVTTKIVHYSSMTYLPLSYLTALVAIRHLESSQIKKWQFWWIGIQGSLLATAFIAVPILLMNKESWIYLVSDPFAAGNLSAPVSWMGWEWMIGVLFLVIIVVSLRLKKSDPKRAFVLLTIGSAFVISSLMVVIVPRVEGYSQRSAIQFFEEHQNENAYFETFKYKSYSNYFYGRVSLKSKSPQTADVHYIVCKVQHIPKLMEKNYELEHLYDQGGFSFYHKLKTP